MNRYWDYTEKERAALSDSEVESLLAAELMEKGVVRVENPTLLPEEAPELHGETYYTIRSGYSTPCYCYKTPEAAAKAMADAIPLTQDYIGGSYLQSVKHGKSDMTIEPIQVYERKAIVEFKSAAEQMAANKNANTEALRIYNDACLEVSRVVQGVWDDWHSCRSTERRYEKIVNTLAEYMTICEGDESKARVFLAKAFPQPDIDAALEWFGIEQTMEAVPA